ncbi:arginine--tRNA ligase [Kitasatospora sp. NBC_01287]|uniref:arginine--tRNA ligase n=1 Tax=Kitasatospora sp. NBC_01287 TaxID=2903573 RepID=UPI002257B858|nr:arginine--tRNA ligase [Kitasatospora sp. NBC_01287]MCX4747340.1 arginine--tRNA ligase [Kitasatospora sp. NBC_01287]
MSTVVVAATSLVEDELSAAMARVLPPEQAGRDPLLRPSEQADFQSGAAFALAKLAGVAPRELAERLAGEIGAGLTAAASGPGFVNVTVADEWLWQQVATRLAAPRLGVGEPLAGQRVVVDYSGPNIAKELHVGHLRSTVIGDALARILGHLGAEVLRQNHLGDWGTQFGMLIQYLDEHPGEEWRDIALLDVLYKAAQQAFAADPAFAERSRRRVVALQAGDEGTLAVWRELVAISEQAFQRVYDRMGLLLTGADADPESAFNDQLDAVVAEFEAAGLAVESEGALCVFAEGVAAPLIVRKRNGGYGYPATDLATIRHRLQTLKADRILYVVDARQALHFTLVFDAAHRIGWLADPGAATHVPFGLVLGPGGTPFKTRSGDSVRLADLLDAAEEAVRAVLTEKPHELDDGQYAEVVGAAAVGAVKYADLANARTKNYVFDLDRMVSLSGDTAVYLQYAHARLRTLLAKAGPDQGDPDPSQPSHPAERALVLRLDAFDAVLREAAGTLEPHRLCGYLYGLAKAFTDFYGSCPVLKAPTPGLRANRLALCRLTAETLAAGLGLLGIAAPERM